ncbi:MAG: hypothetical protein K9J32_07370 [Synechococcus lacustris]|nr:hypothetical protein [Synechococcus lacustris]
MARGIHTTNGTQKNIDSKLQESEIVLAVGDAFDVIKSEFPNCRFSYMHKKGGWTAYNSVEYINHFHLKNNLDVIDPSTLDSIDSADGVSPDGGICFIESKSGFKHIILVSEAKHQGRHDGYTPISDSGWAKECLRNKKLDPNTPIEERPKQANGNAIERAFKNSNTFQGLTSIYGYFPYVVFCDGFDFRTKQDYSLFSHQKYASKYNIDSTIRMRLVSGNYFMPLNNTYVSGAKRGYSTVYPASIYARMEKWTHQEMVDVFVDVMRKSIIHLQSLGEVG